MIGRHRRSSAQELPTLAQARPAGEFVASVLSHLRSVVDVGWNLLDVDAEAHRLIREAGATSCYLDYHPAFGASPFGHVICTSVNEGVLHGLPHDRVLADGDLPSPDFAAGVAWVGAELVAGQLITVEPFLVPTTNQLVVDAHDGWTQLSADGSRGAHAEHTLQVTDGAPVVLTARADDPSPRSSLG